MKERLQVLLPGNPDNFYGHFNVCPSNADRQKLNQAELLIENWHSLMPLKAQAAEQGLDLEEATRWIEGLPQLVQQAYTLLGADWRETAKDWQAAGHTSPPVMLTVCNRTETSARIEYSFRNGNTFWPELHAPNRTLRVDSRVLEKAEVGETAGTAGQDLQNVISVAMLSEGWDAKNDHLGFQVYYPWNGSKRRFIPDFIVRLVNGKTLVLEIKGEDTAQNQAKRSALNVWVKGVNAKGGFGVWCWDVAFEPAKIHDILAAHEAEGCSRQ